MHGPSWRMTQRLPPSLTPLDTALAALLRGVDPVAPVELPLAEAAGCIAAGMPQLAAYPSCDIAAADGWALRANDLVGASSYSPLPLSDGRRSGSMPAMRCRQDVTACSMPTRSRCRVRSSRCWRRACQGRASGVPEATSPRRSPRPRQGI